MLQDYPQLRYIMCLQEGVAMGAAHMYANASGKTGVVNLHVAPGWAMPWGCCTTPELGRCRWW